MLWLVVRSTVETDPWSVTLKGEERHSPVCEHAEG